MRKISSSDGTEDEGASRHLHFGSTVGGSGGKKKSKKQEKSWVCEKKKREKEKLARVRQSSA